MTTEKNYNLWLYYWYATLLPGLLGFLAGWPAWSNYKADYQTLATIWAVLSAALICAQLTALLIWRFSEKGETDKWLLVKDGPSKRIIMATEARNVMVPQLKIRGKNVLAFCESTTTPLVQQLSFGPEPYETAEIGNALRAAIEYTEMSEDDINTIAAGMSGYKKCRVNDPLNFSTSNAKPKLKIDVHITDPRKLIKVGGLVKAAGQLADKIAMYYQARVAGFSAAFVNANADLIGQQLDIDLADELRHRGMKIEPGNGLGITDHGVPDSIRDAITRKAVVQREGDAKIAEAAKAADADVERARGIKTIATAEGAATRIKGREAAKAFAARYKAMTEAKIKPDRIADILQQEAVSSGLPVIAKGVRDVILQVGRGGNPIELWRELGEESDGHPAPTRTGARA